MAQTYGCPKPGGIPGKARDCAHAAILVTVTDRNGFVDDLWSASWLRHYGFERTVNTRSFVELRGMADDDPTNDPPYFLSWGG